VSVLEQGQQVISVSAVAAAFFMTGIVLALPSVQRLIEQRRTQRAREREYARRSRVEVEL